jgi:hypothetical protein
MYPTLCISISGQGNIIGTFSRILQQNYENQENQANILNPNISILKKKNFCKILENINCVYLKEQFLQTRILVHY